jgi:enoyl-CoA hydratase
MPSTTGVAAIDSIAAGFWRRTRFKPVVGLARGNVIGAGLRLLWWCDLAVCTDDTILRAPEISLGADGVWYFNALADRAGSEWAMRVVSTGYDWSGAEAAARGVVCAAVGGDDLDNAGMALAERLVTQPISSLEPLISARRERLHAYEM